MFKKNLLIITLLSICLQVDAQKNIEWLLKAGLFTEVYKIPYNTGPSNWEIIENMPFYSFSFAFYLKKYRTHVQFNYDTELKAVLFNVPITYGSSFPGYYKRKTKPNMSFTPIKLGDTIRIAYWHSNWVNILYNYPIFSQKKIKHELLWGIGLTGRRDIIDYVGYVANPIHGILDYNEYYRFAPNFHVEYLFKPFKYFFISTNLDYAYFRYKPKHYLKWGLSLGSNFSF